MRDWQLIATAPKDGTRVLLTFHGIVATAQWHESLAEPRYRGWWACGYAPAVNATHWMPLPDPPSVGETP